MSEIIICSDELESREGLNLALTGLGRSLSFVSSVELLRTKAQACSPSAILIFDFNFLEKLDDAALKDLEAQFHGPFILVSSRELHMNVAQMKRSERIGHVITRWDEGLTEDLKSVVQQILVPEGEKSYAVGDARDIFHVDPSKVTSFFLDDSIERWECYKRLTEFVRTLPTFNGFEDIAATVASELITNAFYNGPRADTEDKALFSSREEQVKLVPPQKVEFCYWSDDEYFWVMVIDPFGSLKKSRLVSTLHRAVSERRVNLEASGGAGLGLTMIAAWASDLYFGLLEAQSTWVAARLKITRRRTLFYDERSSFHIYEIKQSLQETEL